MTAALKTALREACRELLRHNADPCRITPNARIEAWERLASEPDTAPEQPSGDRDIKPENVLQEAQEQREPGGGAGGAAAPALGPPATADAEQSELSVDKELGGETGALLNTPPPLAPPVGHARLCCARLGSVWCTEPDGHPPPCLGPEEREIASSEYGPGRKRA